MSEKEIHDILKAGQGYFAIAVACIEPKTVKEISDSLEEALALLITPEPNWLYETGKNLKLLEDKGIVQYTEQGEWITTTSAKTVLKKYWGIG